MHILYEYSQRLPFEKEKKKMCAQMSEVVTLLVSSYCRHIHRKQSHSQ